jgi:hypothetical protein
MNIVFNPNFTQTTAIMQAWLAEQDLQGAMSYGSLNLVGLARFKVTAPTAETYLSVINRLVCSGYQVTVHKLDPETVFITA